MDPETKETWIKRLDGNYDLPQRIIPEFVESFSCKHGDRYDRNDENFVQFSSNVII